MYFLFFLLSTFYGAFVLTLYFFWKKIPNYELGRNVPCDTFISVLIPVRNEAESLPLLLHDLSLQNYPSEFFEVIVVDDMSEDNTREIAVKQNVNYKLRVISIGTLSNASGKKKALEAGIMQAAGKIIVATDGDCRVGVNWLWTIQNYFSTHDCKLLVGGVTFIDENTLFNKIQILEFSSLTGTGAASLKAGFPNMCNGANIAYYKTVFEEAGGYEDFHKIASGDDEFLMHKIFRKFPGQVHFLKSSDAVVVTHSKSNLTDFLNQRKRWGGKWKYYIFYSTKLLAVFIFFYNVSVVAATLLCMLGKLHLYLLCILWLIKLSVDCIFLKEVMNFYNKKFEWKIFLFTSIIYPFYVSYFGLMSNIGGYKWKGRNLKNT